MSIAAVRDVLRRDAAEEASARRIRVVVADDSAVVRRVLTRILEGDPRIEVIATARDGAEAIELTAKLRPDVVTMDVNMPRVDGLRAVEVIMGRHPTPIVVISGHVSPGSLVAQQVLARGVVHVMPKPHDLAIATDLDGLAEDIRTKVRKAANVRVIRNANFGMEGRRRAVKPTSSPALLPRDGMPIVAIGASTGGTIALGELLPLLPVDFPACVLVVQHMPAGYTADWARSLNAEAALAVREAEHGDELQPGTVFVAPGGHHMEVRENALGIRSGPRVNYHRPSVDVLFDSLQPLAARVIAMLLSGMGDDGVEGMSRLRSNGAATVAQSEATSVVWGMPGAAVKIGCVERQLSPAEAARYVTEQVRKWNTAQAEGASTHGACKMPEKP